MRFSTRCRSRRSYSSFKLAWSNLKPVEILVRLVFSTKKGKRWNGINLNKIFFILLEKNINLCISIPVMLEIG